VEFRPKVGVAPLLFLISYALDADSWRPEDAHVAADMNLAEAIVPLFARAVHRALAPGLLQGYQNRKDTLATIRGRVRMADQFRACIGLPLPVEVTYDDYTPDILENQLLSTAVDTLGRLHLRHQPSYTSLARLRAQLSDVNPIAIGRHDVPEPFWTRLNERYRRAVALARLIITTAGVQARVGGHDASALLVNTNQVFERFIRAALREQLHLTDATFPPAARGHAIYLDRGSKPAVKLEPDLSWWAHGQCVFAGDCKYKRADGDVPNADIFQMLAYLTALRLDEGWLIYAIGEGIASDIAIDYAGKRVRVRVVDITRAPTEILDQMFDLAAEIRQVAENQRRTWQ
jgi:5-methylcytosine-specific restriction enzyme subunit McrC